MERSAGGFWRELAYSYIFEHPDKFKVANLEHSADLSHLRCGL